MMDGLKWYWKSFSLVEKLALGFAIAITLTVVASMFFCGGATSKEDSRIESGSRVNIVELSPLNIVQVEPIDDNTISVPVSTPSISRVSVDVEPIEPEYLWEPEYSQECLDVWTPECLTPEWYEYYNAEKGSAGADALITRFYGDYCIEQGYEFVSPGEGCRP